MPVKSSFLLTKWYLDCIAESGDTAILYLADLRWKALTIHYRCLLTVLNGIVNSTSSLRGGSAPEVQSRVIFATLPALGIEGTWQALRSPFSKTIFENEHGAVEWKCSQPMSEVNLQVGKTFIGGRGYAERLTISILPWDLPMKELHWGRFLSEHDAVVWIDWRGPYQHRLVLHNGKECEISSITDTEVMLTQPTNHLELDRGLVLRQGRLGDTVFPGLSRLARLLPRSMASVNECKWRSRGVLHSSDARSVGFAIHEVVKWSD